VLSQARSGAIEFCQRPANPRLDLPVTAINAMGFPSPTTSGLAGARGELGKFVPRKSSPRSGSCRMERMWDLGSGQITTSTKRSRAPTISRREVRTRWPEPVSLFSAEGEPVGMQYGEVYSALHHIVDARRPAVADPGRQVLRGPEILLDHQSRLGRPLICANAAAWGRLPADLQEIVARNLNEGAARQREDLAKLTRACRASSSRRG